VIGFLVSGGDTEPQAEVAVPITALPSVQTPPVVAPPRVASVPEPPPSTPDAPIPPRTARAMWKEAVAYQKANPLGTAHAAARFRAIIEEFPNSIEAARAQLRLAELTSARDDPAVVDAARPAQRIMIWKEAEEPEKHTFVRHVWYDDVDYNLFCARDWLSHYSDVSDGMAVYSFDVAHPGLYDFWLRANPASRRLAWRLDWRGAWTGMRGGRSTSPRCGRTTASTSRPRWTTGSSRG
jgi:hypothetical protein